MNEFQRGAYFCSISFHRSLHTEGIVRKSRKIDTRMWHKRGANIQEMLAFIMDRNIQEMLAFIIDRLIESCILFEATIKRSANQLAT